MTTQELNRITLIGSCYVVNVLLGCPSMNVISQNHRHLTKDSLQSYR